MSQSKNRDISVGAVCRFIACIMHRDTICDLVEHHGPETCFFHHNVWAREGLPRPRQLSPAYEILFKTFDSQKRCSWKDTLEFVRSTVRNVGALLQHWLLLFF
jgi:hypothetical protein